MSSVLSERLRLHLNFHEGNRNQDDDDDDFAGGESAAAAAAGADIANDAPVPVLTGH